MSCRVKLFALMCRCSHAVSVPADNETLHLLMLTTSYLKVERSTLSFYKGMGSEGITNTEFSLLN